MHYYIINPIDVNIDIDACFDILHLEVSFQISLTKNEGSHVVRVEHATPSKNRFIA